MPIGPVGPVAWTSNPGVTGVKNGPARCQGAAANCLMSKGSVSCAESHYEDDEEHLDSNPN